MQLYLEKLLTGLATPYSQEQTSIPLKAITAQAWNVDSDASYQGGKLSLGTNLLPNSETETVTDWSAESSFVHKLPAVCQPYTYFHLASAWATRRSAEGLPDSSLFDENRLAAARLVCDQVSTGQYLYYKGAVAGIQKYIYNNIKAEQIGDADRVGKRLRGRSFLVALLGELVAEHLVEALELEQANILFVGGGHFNLLIPNTPKIVNDIEEEIWAINDQLLDQFGLKLNVYGASVSVEANDFTNFGDHFEQVHHALEQSKQRRFAKHLPKVFFQKRLVPNRKLDEEEKARGQRYGKTPEEKQLESLGRLIPKAKLMLSVKGNTTDKNKLRKAIGYQKYLELRALSVDIFLIEGASAESAWGSLWASLEKEDIAQLQLKVHRLNSTDFLPSSKWRANYENLPLQYGFRMLGQYAPVYEDYKLDTTETGIIELSDLACIDKNGNTDLSYQQLAALRLDVDDLGALFAQGLGETANLSRTLALSRELQLFFGGYFNSLAQRHHAYVVYAGGDDAFILASWENILYFLRDLRQDFQKLIADNQEVGFSAGIYMCHAKYPIARLADDAAEAEKKAKRFGALPGKPETALKNAVSVFDHTLSWERYEAMMVFAEKLYANTEKQGGQIKRSVLQVLLRTIQSAHKLKKSDSGRKDQGEHSPAHFELYRNLGRLHGLLSRRNYIGHELMEEILKDMSDFDRFEDYLIPLHYVLYKTRR